MIPSEEPSSKLNEATEDQCIVAGKDHHSEMRTSAVTSSSEHSTSSRPASRCSVRSRRCRPCKSCITRRRPSLLVNTRRIQHVHQTGHVAAQLDNSTSPAWVSNSQYVSSFDLLLCDFVSNKTIRYDRRV